LSDAPDHRYAVILAGGRGTRLWPISTTQQPKQFQSLGDSRSLIEMTFDRLAECVPEDHIYVSTTAGYAGDVREALPRIRQDNLIVEPHPVGKVAAYLLTAMRIQQLDPDAIVLSAAADSFVSPPQAFRTSASDAFAYVEDHPSWTALLACRPTRPDITLGYLHATGRARGTEGVHVLRALTEKPTRAAAKRFIAHGDYFWNSSHYCFAVSTLIEVYRQASPGLYDAVLAYVTHRRDEDYQAADGAAHELLPFIDNGWSVAVVVCDFNWYDIGTWPSLYRALVDSQHRDFIASGSGPHTDIGSGSGLVVNESSLSVVTAGLDDLVVIVSDSVVLVAPMARLEDDPQIVAQFQSHLTSTQDTDGGRS
jgi:mannose-1-phosphate guanylyltransferase